MSTKVKKEITDTERLDYLLETRTRVSRVLRCSIGVERFEVENPDDSFEEPLGYGDTKRQAIDHAISNTRKKETRKKTAREQKGTP